MANDNVQKTLVLSASLTVKSQLAAGVRTLSAFSTTCAMRPSRGGYLLLDTGGLGLQDANTPAKLIAAAEEQVRFAVEAADLILFTVDAREPGH